MAAIMPRSLTPLLLALSAAAAVPAAPAIRPADEAIAKACDGTATLKECVDVLITNYPDFEAPRRLAELAYKYLVKDGEALHKETQAAFVASATMPEVSQNCAMMLNASASFYYDSVARFVPEESKKRFDEAKGNLDELLVRGSTITGVECPHPHLGLLKTKVQNYEDLQKVTHLLMIAANEPPTNALPSPV